jgi:hypothetical protein
VTEVIAAETIYHDVRDVSRKLDLVEWILVEVYKARGEMKEGEEFLQFIGKHVVPLHAKISDLRLMLTVGGGGEAAVPLAPSSKSHHSISTQDAPASRGASSTTMETTSQEFPLLSTLLRSINLYMPYISRYLRNILDYRITSVVLLACTMILIRVRYLKK